MFKYSQSLTIFLYISDKVPVFKNIINLSFNEELMSLLRIL